MRSTLEGQGDQTHVIVHTTLNVTGRPAQFGRGVMAEVGGKLIGIFAANLAEMLAAGLGGAAADRGRERSETAPASDRRSRDGRPRGGRPERSSHRGA